MIKLDPHIRAWSKPHADAAPQTIPVDVKPSDPVPPCTHPKEARQLDGGMFAWCGACGKKL